MQLIEKGKSKRVRRRLLSKPHSLQEALDYARAQEMSEENRNEATKLRKYYRGRVEQGLIRKAKKLEWHQQRVLFLWRHISTRWRKEEMPSMGKEMHHMREDESFCQMLFE